MRIALCLIAGALGSAGCSSEADKPKDPAFLPKPPEVTGPRLDVGSIPDEPAFVGREGEDAHGYPLRQPDMVALINLLRLKRFDTLERWMTYYQAAFEEDYRKEGWPDTMLSAFFVDDPKVGALIDEWVQRSPDHFAPYAARGNFLFGVGQHYRGGKVAEDTSRAQFKTMQDYYRAAIRDLEKAVELRPKLVAAHRRIMQMAQSVPPGDDEKALRAGLAQCPLCFNIRYYYLTNQTPRWGGSYKEMHAFIEETRPLFAKNPKLAALAGLPHLDRCDQLARQGQKAAAAKACEAALAAGDDPRAYVIEAGLLDAKKEPRKVLELLNKALALEPQRRRALNRRFYVRTKLYDFLGAAEDLEIVRHLMPTDAKVAKNVKWMVDKLGYEGNQLAKAGNYSAALAYFTHGLKLAPDDKGLRTLAGAAQVRVGKDKQSVRLKARPNDFDEHLKLDHALSTQRKFAQIIELWDGFISRNPKDPRPYWERSGAKWQLGRHADAIADMQAACDLGMEKACQDVQRMKGRLRGGSGGHR